jgi:hypothetical protein
VSEARAHKKIEAWKSPRPMLAFVAMPRRFFGAIDLRA